MNKLKNKYKTNKYTMDETLPSSAKNLYLCIIKISQVSDHNSARMLTYLIR